ncbi:hypothetical protein K3495_g2422 [Podosphaera aphanis]|nr:hypothetical protein K3495_g2422 [Podosphaera aphanis]
MLVFSQLHVFSSTATQIQALTYLFAVCLFSISFLVFLNASASFVITDLIGEKDRIGELVGTLGFADELVALAACPFWGILSDRLGVRNVCVAGYTIIALSLFTFVQARNVYPQLLLARILFSIGGAACTTMVTTILPIFSDNSVSATRTIDSHSSAPSCSYSQTTITPANFNTGSQCERNSRLNNGGKSPSSSPSRLAGLVGLFTGSGALVALAIFLPLPTRFTSFKGITQGQAITDSFYVVGTISVAIACACFFGLRGLRGEESKGWGSLIQNVSLTRGYEPLPQDLRERETQDSPFQPLSFWRSLRDSVILGFTDAQIALAYVGGFVARASSVGISSFIPLYVNAFYIRNDLCHVSPKDPLSEVKRECRAAYILASELTGVSQLVALLCAPIFGYFSDRSHRFNFPLLVASVFGIVGYISLARLSSPEFKDVNSRGGSPAVFLIVSLIGASQIGAIVCSLGLLGRGILMYDSEPANSGHPHQSQDVVYPANFSEESPLVTLPTGDFTSRTHLKGSIAGVYSLSGGAAILLLTKLGGYLFDNLSIGAPFYIMAIFNALLLVFGTGVCVDRRFGSITN